MRIGNLVFQWIRLPKQPTTIKHLTGNKVRIILKKENSNADIHLADRTYRVYDEAEIMPIFKMNRFSEMTYVPEDRDCDDFSWAFVGMMKKLLPGCTVGMVWADIMTVEGELDYKHAFCFFIDENDNLMYVEPQSNRVFSPKKTIKPYLFIV